MQEFFNSQEFYGLVATAILTGTLVPLIKLVFDNMNLRKQKLLEDQLAKQNNIAQSQIKFFENISQLLWEFHALIAKVSYYRILDEAGSHKSRGRLLWPFSLALGKHTQPRQLVARYEKYKEEYEDHFWELVIQQMQSEISKSRRLVSNTTYKQLESLYWDAIIKLDKELVCLQKDNDASVEKWITFHEVGLKGTLVGNINETLLMLAKDMGLKTGKS